MYLFEWNCDYTRAIAPTPDPRILAVIEVETYPERPDWDHAPTIYGYEYGSRAHLTTSGWTDSALTDYLQRAYREWGEDWQTIERAFRIIGAPIHHLSSSIDRYSWAVVIDSPAWRDAMGIPQNRALTSDDLASDVAAYLDGEVYGIGYAVNPARVTDETEYPSADDIDTADGWTIDMTCWGFYGQSYAQESALTLEHGGPMLPELLALP